MNENEAITAQPLDRTTERVVSELASRILPPLAQILERVFKEGAAEEEARRQALIQPLAAAADEISSLRVLCGELTESLGAARAQAKGEALEEMSAALTRIEGALRALPAKQQAPQQIIPPIPPAHLERVQRIEKLLRDDMNEARAVRQALLQPLGSLIEELTAVKGATAKSSADVAKLAANFEALRSEGSAKAELEKYSARQEEARRALQSLAEELAALRQGLQNLEGPRHSEGEGGNRTPTASEGALVQLLEVAIPSWEGLLRANSQAQTRELDALSKELANLQDQAGVTLTQNLQDALRQEIAKRDAEWEKRLEAERAQTQAQMERWMRMLYKGFWILAGLGGLVLLLSIARLVR